MTRIVGRACCTRCIVSLFGFLTLLGLTRQFSSSLTSLVSRPSSLWMRYNTSTRKPTTVETAPTGNTRQKPVPPVQLHVEQKKHHLLINSYMNSGSRFIGRLFGFREDTFYFYEPLWQFSVWDYFHVPNLVCSSTSGSKHCRVGSIASINNIRDNGRPKRLVRNISSQTPVGMMVDILKDIYNCNFSRIEDLIVTAVHGDPNLSGPSWNGYAKCIRSRVPKSTCIRRQEEVCKSASHVVTKVLRMTTYALESLLATTDNIKVIQLFRDPRAVINSRMESAGYPVRDFNINSQLLCHKMLLDINGGMVLREKYTNKFIFVFYEDIKSNVTLKIDKISRFLGMSVIHDLIGRLNTVIPNKSKSMKVTKSRTSDNANWWRHHISFPRYKQVQANCKDVAKHWNLIEFKDAKQMANMSVPAMDLKYMYTIN